MAATIPNAIGLYRLAAPEASQPSSSLEGTNPLTGEKRIFMLLEAARIPREADLESALQVYDACRGRLLPRVLDRGRVGSFVYLAFESVADARPLSLTLTRPVSADWAMEQTESIIRAVFELHRFGIPHGRLSESMPVEGGEQGRVLLPPPDFEMVLFESGYRLEDRLAEDARTLAGIGAEILSRVVDDPYGLASSVRSKLLALRSDYGLRIDTLVDVVKEVHDSLGQTAAPRQDRTERPDPARAAPSAPDQAHVSTSHPAGSLLRLPERYHVQREIARGGMGVVLEARDQSLRREVALKVLLDGSSSEAHARFVEEAQVQGQLEHPNICPVHELAEDLDGLPYFTMKRVRGEPLSARLRRIKEGRESHDLSGLLGVFVKTCDAVAFAHSRGVLHRDLKPANIMTGEFGEVQVMDWGIAKVGANGRTAASQENAEAPVAVSSDARADGQALTHAGSAMGTPHYMSPEQFLAAEAVDQRSDVYALGAILYEILTLTTPVDGNNLGSIIRKVQGGEILEPSKRARDRVIPRDLELATMKALATRREARHSSVSELRADVQAFLDGRTMASVTYSPAERLLKWSRRNRAFVRTAAAALLGFVVLSAGYVLELRAQYRVERRRVAETLLAESKALAQAGRYAGTRARLRELEALEIEDPLPVHQGRLFAWSLQASAPDVELAFELGFRAGAVAGVSGSSRVVIGGEQLELWDLPSGSRVVRYEAPSIPIRTVEVGPSGDLVFALSRSGRAAVFRIDGELPIWTAESVTAGTLLGHSGQVALARGRKLRVEDVLPAPASAGWDLTLPGLIESVVVDSTESVALVRYQPRHLAVVHLRSRRIVRESVLGAPLSAPLAVSSGYQLLAGVRAGSSELELLPVSAGPRLERAQMARLPGGAFTTLDRHEAPPTSVVFLPGGDRVLVGDRSGQALLWSVPERKVLRSFVGGTKESLVADLVPAAGLVVGVTESGRVLGWPLDSTPGRVRVSPAPLVAARAMVFSPSGTLLWTHTVDDEMIDADSGELFGVYHRGVFDLEARGPLALRRRLARAGEVVEASTSPDGSALARLRRHEVELTALSSAGVSGDFTLPSDLDPGRVAVGPLGTPLLVFGAVGAAASKLVVYARNANSPEVWAENVLISSRMVVDPVGAQVAFGGRPTLAAEAGPPCLVLMSLRARGELQCHEGHGGEINDLVYASNAPRLYTAGEDGKVIAWDVEGPVRARWSVDLGARVHALAHLSKERLLFAGLETGNLVILNEEGVQLLVWSSGPAAITKLAVGHAGRLAIAARDRSLQIVDPVAWLARPSDASVPGSPSPRDTAAVSGIELQVRELRDEQRAKLRHAEAEQLGLEALAFRGREAALRAALADARSREDRALPSRVLSHALRFQNDAAVEATLAAGADPTEPDARGVVPIAHAVMLGREDYLERLLRAGARLAPSGALAPAIASALAPWAHPLRSAGSPPSVPRRRGRRGAAPAVAKEMDPEVVGTALEAGNLGLLEALAREGERLGRARVGVEVESALAHAVRRSQQATVARMLALGADPNEADEETTPLVEACRLGDGPLVQLLLAHGADPNRAAGSGLTPLTASFLAADPYPAAKHLLVGGANPSLEDVYGRRPIELALGLADAAVLRALLSAGADPEARLAGGQTALHRAVETRRVEHVRALLAAGARSSPDGRGLTPEQLSAARAQPEVAALLDAVR